MRRLCLCGSILICLLLLSFVVVTGCGEDATPGTTIAGTPTTAPAATTTTYTVTGAGETTTTGGTATTPSDVTTTPGSTPTTAPDSDATPTSSAGVPSPITYGEIEDAMSAVGMGTVDQLQVFDYKNFGHYAAAYVGAADENVYLVLFNDETGGWAILAMITGLDWEAVQAELLAKAAPEDLIEWAKPGQR